MALALALAFRSVREQSDRVSQCPSVFWKLKRSRSYSLTRMMALSSCSLDVTSSASPAAPPPPPLEPPTEPPCDTTHASLPAPPPPFSAVPPTAGELAPPTPADGGDGRKNGQRLSSHALKKMDALAVLPSFQERIKTWRFMLLLGLLCRQPNEYLPGRPMISFSLSRYLFLSLSLPRPQQKNCHVVEKHMYLAVLQFAPELSWIRTVNNTTLASKKTCQILANTSTNDNGKKCIVLNYATAVLTD